jgi:hypothetical protein
MFPVGEEQHRQGVSRLSHLATVLYGCRDGSLLRQNLKHRVMPSLSILLRGFSTRKMSDDVQS